MEENIAPPADISDDDRLWAALSWALGLPALIVFLMEDKKSRPFIKYNAVQAIGIMIIMTLVSWTVCGAPLIWFYALYLAYQSYQGQLVEVPILTDFCKKQGWI